MGLGKTLQSLSFLMLMRREGAIRSGHPALVVAPTSLLRDWQDEHAQHTYDISLCRAVENCRRALTGEAPLHVIGLDERLMQNCG